MTETFPLPPTQPPEQITDHRPWGGFTQYAQNELCTVKLLWVSPGQMLSLQNHRHRSELWVIVAGEMEVELDGTTQVLRTGEQIFIPCGAKHRARGLEATCRWMEISFGRFDEDDITRFSDQYGRA